MQNSYVKDPDDLHIASEVQVGDEIFISWAVTNLGPYSINQEFFVDLYFNGVVVQRWKNETGVSRNGSFFVNGWKGLPSVITPYSGRHTLKLVIDATDLIVETDEADNTYELTFDWLEPIGSLPPAVPTDIFDLLPHTPNGWSDAIVANAIIDSRSSGELSINLRTYVSYAFANSGDKEVPESTIVPVYLYFDDVLVDIEYWQGVPGGGVGMKPAWPSLHRSVNLSEGRHRLRIEIDPLNQVLEINESNNTYEVEFEWGPPVGGP